jgi:hypothetical protein
VSKNTARTLKYYRELGYHADMVERFISFPPPGHRKDYFGFGDILAFNNNETLMIQSCGQSYASHLSHLLANPNVPLWLAGPRKLILIGWRKLKVKRGGKAMRWTPRIKEITHKDFKIENGK